MPRVRIFWYQLQDTSVVGLREGRKQPFCFKQDGTVETFPDTYIATKRILGTYVVSDGSRSLQTRAKIWMNEYAEGEGGKEPALVKVVAFGDYLKAKRQLEFEWNESSLGILKARVNRLPLDAMRVRRKKIYWKLESELERAKEAKEIEVVSEKLKEMKSSIERLDLVIKERTIMIREYEEDYNREYNEERASTGQNKAVKNSSKK
ncbi:hypothetical protein BGAL_0049g00140 [Botrytis galanthina]|uniref:Uncharacterized protein n=1 Tax=Botrytis galanthina TaxID=278940 RepID=A0A4S8RG00_9HELO|nr:hypothetical protein BGAL_0049g00140 [Botrytis galanthina]